MRAAPFVLAPLTLVTAGCVGLGPSVSPRLVTHPDQRIVLRGFSVLPPRGPDWSVVPELIGQLVRAPGAYGVVFVKRLRDRPPATPEEAQTVLAIVIATTAPSPGPEGVLDEAMRRRREEVASSRFGGGTLTARPSAWAGAVCRRYEFSTEDHGNLRFPDAVFIVAGQGLLCAHPQEPTLVIDAHVSQRTLRGLRPRPLAAEVDPFLNSLAFTRID